LLTGDKEIHINGYTFSIDAKTGTTVATGQIQAEKAERNTYLQRVAGGELRQAGDQGGHLVAVQHGGPPIRENLFAQDGKLNQGGFKELEQAEHKLITDPERSVSIETKRFAYMSQPAQSLKDARPEAFMINDTIKEGDVQQEVHLSFANLSTGEQEAFNAAVGQLELPPEASVSLPEGLSQEEYAQIMEETDATLPSVGDEIMPDDAWSYQPEGRPECGQGQELCAWEFEPDASVNADDLGIDISASDSLSSGSGDDPDSDAECEGADCDAGGPDQSSDGADPDR